MLNRTAIVTLYGRGQEERTAAFYAVNLAVHELDHARKLDRAMATWRAERAHPGGRAPRVAQLTGMRVRPLTG